MLSGSQFKLTLAIGGKLPYLHMLQPYIDKKFGGQVWRLVIDEVEDIISLEIRKQEDKLVRFASMGLTDGEVYFDDLITEERWLTGIETVHNGIILLHHYMTDSRPEHKGLIAVDALTGSIKWRNYNVAFDHLSVNGPVIYDTRVQPRKLLLADIQTGATIRPCQPSIDTVPGSRLIFPQEVLTASLTGKFAFQLTSVTNTAHYLEYNNFRIVSLHTLVEGTLKQHLYIMDETGLVYQDLLNTDIQKLQPESFLMLNNRLIYLKNKSEIKVLDL